MSSFLALLLRDDPRFYGSSSTRDVTTPVEARAARDLAEAVGAVKQAELEVEQAKQELIETPGDAYESLFTGSTDVAVEIMRKGERESILFDSSELTTSRAFRGHRVIRLRRGGGGGDIEIIIDSADGRD